MFADEENQMLDVVNADDEITGQVKRSDMFGLAEKPDQYLRAAEIFIQRSNGDIYLPRRSTKKKLFPGGFDLSAAGHILSGESYTQACVRELKEETGIDADPHELHFVKRINPTPQLFYFRMLYLLRSDKQPVLSPEHTSASWVSVNNLEQTVRGDVPTKDTLYEDIPFLIDFLKREGYDK